MRICVVAAILLLCASQANAQSEGEKKCVLEAAQHLPRVPGISISNTRVTPAPNPPSVPGAIFLIIELDAKAAGMTTTYKYLCVNSPHLTQAQRLSD